jgi:hypothetical protein
MKNLFDAAVANQIKVRLGKLEPQSERRWGKMTAAQMMAHCSVSMQWATGEVVPEKGPLPVRLLGRLVKPLVFRNEDPLRKNSPTAKSLIVSEKRVLGEERERLLDKFAAEGAAGCTKNPHSFFGKMTPEEWAILMYKHLDHHSLGSDRPTNGKSRKAALNLDKHYICLLKLRGRFGPAGTACRIARVDFALQQLECVGLDTTAWAHSS